MIHIVGAGSGAADLITLRGARLLRAADVVVWAGSLVNPELLAECKESCIVYDSAHMTLEEVLDVMCAADARGEEVVRLHTGDPCLYGAIQEQMDALDARGVDYEVVPGRVELLRCRGGASPGVHAAGNQPVGRDHAAFRTYPHAAGEGCAPWRKAARLWSSS